MHLRSAAIMLIYQKALRLVPSFTETRKGEESSATVAEVMARQPRLTMAQRFLAMFIPASGQKVEYEGSVGQIMNLITADVDRFTFLMPYSTYLLPGRT